MALNQEAADHQIKDQRLGDAEFPQILRNRGVKSERTGVLRGHRDEHCLR